MVLVLLEAGADIAARDLAGATALDEALRFKHTPTVELLMAHGAKLESGGQTAASQLQGAVLHGQADIVSLLLDKGGDALGHINRHL